MSHNVYKLPKAIICPYCGYNKNSIVAVLCQGCNRKLDNTSKQNVNSKKDDCESIKIINDDLKNKNELSKNNPMKYVVHEVLLNFVFLLALVSICVGYFIDTLFVGTGFVVVALLIAFSIVNAKSDKEKEFDLKIKKFDLRTKEIEDIYRKKDNEIHRANKKLEDKQKAIEVLYNEKSIGFPWLARAYADLESIFDGEIEKKLRHKKRPAKKAADQVKQIKKEKKELIQLNKINEYIIDYYESIVPRLKEYKDELIDDKYIRVGTYNNPDYNKDVLSDWLSEGEFDTLSDQEKNQLVLDRYKKRKKSKLEIGLDYERYIGYLYEQKGYQVNYHGINKGLDDLGIDLICKKDNSVCLIQCKYWSQLKEIHENTVNQLFGTTYNYIYDNYKDINISKFYELIDNGEVTPVIITSTKLSERAHRYVHSLGITSKANVKMDVYPLIKCHIGNSGEKIYHLPFDQQYDKIVNSNNKLMYCRTIKEAESLGFRRAYRWKGNMS